jgi:hypothetical protein
LNRVLSLAVAVMVILHPDHENGTVLVERMVRPKTSGAAA